MEIGKSIEIPFGAKDSELKAWECTIPEGMEAEIKDGKIIVREKESEDERIIDRIKKAVNDYWSDEPLDEILAWLEKQGSQNLANSAKTCKDEQNPAWKPSDEQIKAIRLARSFVTDDFSDNPTLSEILIELEEQLKKLKR